MQLLCLVLAAVPLLDRAAAGAIPLPRLRPRDATSTATVTSTVYPHQTTGAATTTATPSPTFGPRPTSCDLEYCADGTSYCQYWGGYSSFDVSQRRPVPGETFTAFALCSTLAVNASTAAHVTATATATTGTSLHLDRRLHNDTHVAYKARGANGTLAARSINGTVAGRNINSTLDSSLDARDINTTSDIRPVQRWFARSYNTSRSSARLNKFGRLLFNRGE